MITLSNYGYNILQIETYGLCNMACGFCPYPLKKDFEKKSKLEDETIKKVIDEINPEDKDFKYLTFSQFNEPLLDKRIFDYIKYAKDRKLEVYFITNGLLLDKEDTIKKLIELNPIIKISLQILDNSKHKLGRGLNMELEKYLEKIIKFLRKIENSDLKVTLDVGSNFNSSKVKFFFKKILGLQVGDPNLPDSLKSTLYLLSQHFHKLSKKDNLQEELIGKDQFIDNNYLKQDGIKISKNVQIKIKPFGYGYKIKDFHPINDNFSCETKILAVQSSGSVVPCCLAYDDSISLGSVTDNSLEDILKENSFLSNLRKKGGKKHITCKKCYGEPTKRGAFVRNFLNAMR